MQTVSALLVGILVTIFAISCGSGGPYTLETFDGTANQWLIAKYHSQEAARLRRKADELIGQARIYSRIFGSESEWTTGTLLLAQTYNDAADEQERLAEDHLGVVRSKYPSKNLKEQ
jgi:hypothetical protein